MTDNLFDSLFDTKIKVCTSPEECFFQRTKSRYGNGWVQVCFMKRKCKDQKELL